MQCVCVCVCVHARACGVCMCFGGVDVCPEQRFMKNTYVLSQSLLKPDKFKSDKFKCWISSSVRHVLTKILFFSVKKQNKRNNE